MKCWDLTFHSLSVCFYSVQLDTKSHLSLLFEIDAIILFDGFFLTTYSQLHVICLDVYA